MFFECSLLSDGKLGYIRVHASWVHGAHTVDLSPIEFENTQ